MGEKSNDFSSEIRLEYEQLAKDHENKQEAKTLITIGAARSNRVEIDWFDQQIQEPSFLGIKSFKNFPLEEIREYIDWTPFFSTWMLKGKYPYIFENETVGSEAKNLLRKLM